MRKLFMLTAFFALTMSANAENRKWDFTNWSSATLQNLAADAQANGGTRWTTIEKASGDGETNGNCYWYVPEEETELATVANGQTTTITETQGLVFNCSGRSLALAVNYQTTWDGLGPYSGPSYLWMGGKNNKFTIKGVKPGANITMDVESHRLTDGRGVSLSVNGTAIKIIEGSEKPKERTTCVWQIPADISNGELVDVTVTNSNGCHIYYIDLQEDAPAVDGAKIAYVFNSGYNNYDASNDAFRDIIENNGEFTNITFDALDVSQEANRKTPDELKAYDVVVVSGYMPADDQYAPTLREAIAYVPMLNLNPQLYATWGYGTPKTADSPSLDVAEEALDDALFKPSNESDNYITDGKLAFFEEGSATGVEIPEGSYFANDRVLATVGGATAIHEHNAGRNTYMLIPYGADNQFYAVSIVDILTNAIKELNYSKKEITKAATPKFTEDYKQMNTDVTIASDTEGAKIYYTTDGTTPTDASTPYTGPVNISEPGTTITAVAYADGYDPSEPATLNVALHETSAMPTITTAEEDGKAIVTLTNNEPNATLYYNFTGVKDATASSVYTSPITITHPTTIYAFAGEVLEAEKVASELASKDITITGKEVRLDVVSHFDANAADWSLGESKTKYYTEGEKNGYNYYEVVSHVEELPDGRDTTIIDSKEPLWNLTVVNPGKGWEAKTYGQGMLWERITISDDISDANTDKRYRGETAFDQGASDNSVTFGNIRKSDGVENDPYSCHIQSTEAFQGPFDIVTYVGNASSSNQPKAALFISTDTLSEDNWTFVDSVYFSKTQRYIKKNIASYEGTDKVFVKLQAAFSSVMVFDIYIMNHGELSGIKDVDAAEEATGEVVRTLIYSINGTRLNAPAKGINIIREVYDNGSVKTRKVVVR